MEGPGAAGGEGEGSASWGRGFRLGRDGEESVSRGRGFRLGGEGEGSVSRGRGFRLGRWHVLEMMVRTAAEPCEAA